MRTTALPVLVAVLAGSLVAGAGGAPPVAAAVRPAVASPLSAVPGTMWQTNGTVSALAHAGGVLYVGGSFTHVRPPGTAAGSAAEVPQAYLAAFRTSDMSLIADWRPRLAGATAAGGAVQALEVSPDGSRLYVGGDFGTVDGVNRSKVAAYDIADPLAPRLLGPTQFSAAVNGRVFALSATGDALYVAGSFTRAGGGTTRNRVAAFATSSGALLPWNVDLQGTWGTYPTMANAIEATPDRVYVGGMFNTVNGAASHGLTAVDPVVGTRDSGFTTPPIVESSYVTTMLVSGGMLYVAARDSKSPNANRLEGVMAMAADTGEVRWGRNGQRCMGDSFSLLELAGTVWVGTHAHDCASLNGHPEVSFPEKSSSRFLASVIGHDPATGELRHFFPGTSGLKSVPGSLDNVRAFATDGTRLFVGGGWLNVNGLAQQNLTVFRPRTAAGSEAPTRVTVKAGTDSTGRATVTWTSSTDRDDRDLTYRVYRGKETTPFATRTVPSAFWDRQSMAVVDEGVVAGQSVTYRVDVSDGAATTRSLVTPVLVVGGPATAYDEAVRRDAPAVLWKLDEPAGSTTVKDSSGRAIPSGTIGTVRFGQAGAVQSGGTSAAFSGSGVSTRQRAGAADTYSLETWFRTTTTSGGKLLGIGSSATGTSGQYDRHVYMTNAGRLVYGTYPGSVQVLTSAASYNDGSWHHVVASQDAQGMRLHVDGVLVGSNAVTGFQPFPGYLRAGGDNINGWPGQPTSSTFAGELDEVAYYTRALRSDQVAAHWALR